MGDNISEQVSNLMDAFLEVVEDPVQQQTKFRDIKTIGNKPIPESKRAPSQQVKTNSITFAEMAKYVYGYDAKDNVKKEFEKLIVLYKENHPELVGTYLTNSILKKDVPLSITNFIKRMKIKDEKDLVTDMQEQKQFAKLLKERLNEVEILRADMEKNLQLNAVNLLALSDFMTPKFKQDLAKVLGLDQDLFPVMTSKDIYYHINVVRVRVKLHGKMHNDTYPESQYSRDINKLEGQLLEALDVSSLKGIPENHIKNTQHDVFVIMALYNLLSRTNPSAITKLNINNLFISIFDKLLEAITEPKQRESLSKFLIRIIQHNKKQGDFNIDNESPEVILGAKYLTLAKESVVEEQEQEQEQGQGQDVEQNVMNNAQEDRAIQEERSDLYGGYADFFNDL
jgi:hypothetical protein